MSDFEDSEASEDDGIFIGQRQTTVALSGYSYFQDLNRYKKLSIFTSLRHLYQILSPPSINQTILMKAAKK